MSLRNSKKPRDESRVKRGNRILADGKQGEKGAEQRKDLGAMLRI